MSKGIAFSFGKTKAKPNSIAVNNKFNEDKKTENEILDFVTSIDDNQINSTVKKEEKKELVIPLIVNNRYYLKRDSNKEIKKEENKNENSEQSGEELPPKETPKELSLEERAKLELLREAMATDDLTKNDSSRVIPVLDTMIQNRVPDGFESDGNFDVSLRPTEPTTADYGEVPVEEFGLAMLRGMGWKPGMAIGANTKDIYEPKDPVIRPKGLGLGADRSMKTQAIAPSKDVKEEDLQPKKGSFVCIEFGAQKGAYGVIEDFDEDMSRVTVRLSLKKEIIRTPMALVRVVSKKEFDTEAKVINKNQYEEYKLKEESKDIKPQVKREVSTKKSDSHSKKSDSKSKHEDNHKKHSSHKSWLLPNLRVRIIDKKYKNGSHYKEKVVICDVLSSNRCSCKTNDQKVLEDIDSRMLETVIPRETDANVMILEGKYRKELGLVLKKNKDKSEAEVQLLSDKRKVIKLSFDDICEYVR